MPRLLSNLPALQEAHREACKSINGLEEALRPFFQEIPFLFPKPLAEMGASEKLKMASSLCYLLKDQPVSPKDD